MGGLQTGLAGSEIAAVMAGTREPTERVDERIASQIRQAVTRDDLTPDELFVVCIRFAQAANRSNFKKLLAPRLETWARA
jgi:hypothetical protein